MRDFGVYSAYAIIFLCSPLFGGGIALGGVVVIEEGSRGSISLAFHIPILDCIDIEKLHF